MGGVSLLRTAGNGLGQSGATVKSIRVAILGDTHGALDPRIAKAVAGCDYAVHTGDVGCAGVLNALRPKRGLVVSVRGNNDVTAKWPGDEAHIPMTLPLEAELELPGGQLVVVHGHRSGPARSRHAWLRRHYPNARAIAYGHSHRHVCDDGALPWVLNPGAAGRARTFGGPSFIVLEAGKAHWQVAIVCFDMIPKHDISTRRLG